MLTKNSLVKHETVDSAALHSEDGWDPDWITYAFTAWASCRNAACKQNYAIVGNGGVSLAQDDEGNLEWEEFFTPKLFVPSLRIIKMPERCPELVVGELEASFASYWLSRSSCAARIRSALEQLMDHVGIARRKKANSGKFFDLSLHSRIEAFSENHPEIGGQLMALKWLGNTAAHESEISVEDLLDAFEVLEHVLIEVIDERSRRVAALARQITRKHAPRKKK